MNIELRNELAEILQEAANAHHEAFIATDGNDPDWPIWYADYLLKSLAQRFDLMFTKSRLIYCLMAADFEHQAKSPGSRWAEFFADEIIARHAPSESSGEDKLALYHFNGCPFCAMVRSAIDRLDIDVELRDIFEHPHDCDELINARGRATVPVLRITSPGGDERWMPESRDIVHYLETTYA